MLRYGETSGLPLSQAKRLLEALQALAHHDPYFRSSDWEAQIAPGLMVPELQNKIGGIIVDSHSNPQLRSLLIEALKDTSLGADLSSTLEVVLFSIERSVHERAVAAEALLGHRDRLWWRTAIASLRAQGTSNSTHLARWLIEVIDVDVDDLSLVSTLYAEMGVTIRPLPREKKYHGHRLRSYSRNHRSNSRRAAAERARSSHRLLDTGGSIRPRGLGRPRQNRRATCLRAINQRVIGPADAPKLWIWLSILHHTRHTYQAEFELRAGLRDEIEIRHAVQLHALYTARPKPTIWLAEFELEERLVGLRGRPDDIIPLLNRLAEYDNRDKALREDWRDLMALGLGRGGLDPALRTASLKFQRGNRQLQSFVKKLENPKTPAREVRQQRETRGARESNRSDSNVTAALFAPTGRRSAQANSASSRDQPKLTSAISPIWENTQRQQTVSLSGSARPSR